MEETSRETMKLVRDLKGETGLKGLGCREEEEDNRGMGVRDLLTTS